MTAALKMTATETSNPFVPSGFFAQPLQNADPAVWSAIQKELRRQQDCIELIASENIVSAAVMEAQGSIMTNKYAEGYPGKRYYGGCEYVDVTEQLAIDRACQLFRCQFANVQPHSGAQANQAVFFALLSPGDTFMGLSLPEGGHITHGLPISVSGKWFHPVPYGLNAEGKIDYDQVAALAAEHKPKLIIAGASAYPHAIDFARFRAIADSVGAYLMSDVAHYAGLIVTDCYPNPFPHSHVVTTTTHKTLRGPRGGMILTNDADLAKKINSAVFPGLQGGPLEHVIAAKAVAFGEALKPEFKAYCQQVVKNAHALANELIKGGLACIGGGTDSHKMLVDLRPMGLTGKAADYSLHNAGLTCNKNSIPNDPEKPMVTSGIRLGTPAGTTRGFREAEFREVGQLILEVLAGLKATPSDNSAIEQSVKKRVKALCDRFPIYPELG